MLGCNKNYATIALNCILKNSKRTLSTLEINRRYRNNNIKQLEYIKLSKELL